MSDIYTHEPVMDFTNPFLDFDQGYVRPFATILPTVKATLIPIPSEEESVLPKKPLTRKELKTRMSRFSPFFTHFSSSKFEAPKHSFKS